MENVKLRLTRFFTGLLKNLHRLLFANVLFAVPLAGFTALIWWINSATGLNNTFLTFLPIIPVFPFFAGVTLVTRNIVRGDEHVPVFRLFVKGIKENFLLFLVHGVVLYMAVFFCYSSITLYWRMAQANGVMYFVFGISVLIAIALLFMFYNLPVMTVTFDLSVKNLYKNAALISFGEIKNNFFATVGLFVLFLISATVYITAPSRMVLAVLMAVFSVLIVPSVASYIMNFYVFEDMEQTISNGQGKTEEIQRKIDAQRAKRNGEEPQEEKEVYDFSGLDLDERKDPDEYLYFNGKMLKRSTLIKMRDEQESSE